MAPTNVIFTVLPPATKLGQGNIFRSVCQEFCPQRGGACMAGGMYGRGACVAGGRAWQGVCVGVHGGHAWQGWHAWQGGAWHTVNEQAVRILLECILVFETNVYLLYRSNCMVI